MIIGNYSDLESIRHRHGLLGITINTQKFKYRGLLPWALKYSLWALAEGGKLTIQDAGLNDPGLAAFEVSFNSVRRTVMKFVGPDTSIVDYDPKGVIELERTSAPPRPGWSAGVVFSGSDAELPVLNACLEGLLAQPELSPELGGEIAICGPPRDLSFMSRYKRVRYLEYLSPAGPRFLIGHKKNFLIEALQAERMIILHSRIVLQPGAITAAPNEFDIASPNVFVASAGRMAPYLSLVQNDSQLGRMSRRHSITTRYMKESDGLKLAQHGIPYVDGGAFFVSKRAYGRCKFDPLIAWEEAEDSEWCTRAYFEGLVCELIPTSRASSQTAKLKTTGLPPPVSAFVHPVLRSARVAVAAARHYSLLALRRR